MNTIKCPECGEPLVIEEKRTQYISMKRTVLGPSTQYEGFLRYSDSDEDVYMDEFDGYYCERCGEDLSSGPLNLEDEDALYKFLVEHPEYQDQWVKEHGMTSVMR